MRSELIVLRVLRRERLSPGFVRVTLGGDDIERFVPLGFDQWFRLFIPVAGGTLERLPGKLDMLAYARYLTIAKATRPVLRNYSVRAWRPEGPDGPELDVDFVLHEDADGHSGPAATWAQTCRRGDVVAIIDEGIAFTPAEGVAELRLVADETGLPAVGGILASLVETAPEAAGVAVVEVPHPADRLDLVAPAGVRVEWVVRGAGQAVPGAAALTAALELVAPRDRAYGWAVGESALPIGMRRHWIAQGLAKNDILFCGYWKSARR